MQVADGHASGLGWGTRRGWNCLVDSVNWSDLMLLRGPFTDEVQDKVLFLCQGVRLTKPCRFFTRVMTDPDRLCSQTYMISVSWGISHHLKRGAVRHDTPATTAKSPSELLAQVFASMCGFQVTSPGSKVLSLHPCRAERLLSFSSEFSCFSLELVNCISKPSGRGRNNNTLRTKRAAPNPRVTIRCWENSLAARQMECIRPSVRKSLFLCIWLGRG